MGFSPGHIVLVCSSPPAAPNRLAMSVNLLNRLVTRPLSQVPLRTVLIVPFVLQIFAAVGLVGYLSWRNGQKTVNDLAAQLMGEVGDRIQLRLNNYLNTPHQLNQHNQTVLEQGLLSAQDMPGLERFLLVVCQEINEG